MLSSAMSGGKVLPCYLDCTFFFVCLSYNTHVMSDTTRTPWTPKEKIATIVCCVLVAAAILAVGLWLGWLSKTSIATFNVLVSSSGTQYSYQNFPKLVSNKKITTVVLAQSDTTNDGHPLTVATVPSCADMITYRLDNVVVDADAYTQNFDAASQRTITIDFPSNVKHRSDTCTVNLQCDGCVNSDSLYVTKDTTS